MNLTPHPDAQAATQSIGPADLVARVLYGGRDRTQREFEGIFARAGLRWTRTLPVDRRLSVMEAVPERHIEGEK